MADGDGGDSGGACGGGDSGQSGGSCGDGGDGGDGGAGGQGSDGGQGGDGGGDQGGGNSGDGGRDGSDADGGDGGQSGGDAEGGESGDGSQGDDSGVGGSDGEAGDASDDSNESADGTSDDDAGTDDGGDGTSGDGDDAGTDDGGVAGAQGQPGAADASVADSYSIDTRAVSETTGTIGSLLSHTADVIGGMVGAMPDGAVFGGIGRAVASASQALSDTQVSALDQVRQALEHVNRGIDASNLGYQQVDQAVAAGFGAVVGAQPAAAAEQPATAPAADMTTDRELRDQLAADEGNEQHVYTDTEGHPSVGIGFNLDRADARSRLAAVGADYTAVRNGTQDLTADQVNQLFSHDVGTAVDTARDYYAGFDQLDAARQRTLTNMAFNLGAARLGGFHQLHDALANGDWNAAADAMQDSRWARQVPNRADRLIDHMRTGQ